MSDLNEIIRQNKEAVERQANIDAAAGIIPKPVKISPPSPPATLASLGWDQLYPDYRLQVALAAQQKAA